jgi:hypothetical protein
MNAPQPGEQTSEWLMAHLNKRAVFRDSRILILVTVLEIRIAPVRLRIRLEPIEQLMQGGRIKSPAGRTFTVSGIWENVTVQPRSWSNSSQGCSWHVIPDESSFDAVRRLCETEPELDPAALFALADYAARHPMMKEIPMEIREAAMRRIGNGRIGPS